LFTGGIAESQFSVAEAWSAIGLSRPPKCTPLSANVGSS